MIGTATVEAALPTTGGLDLFTTSFMPRSPLMQMGTQAFESGSKRPVIVFNVEQLYSAVNDPQNAGRQIVLVPGLYLLSPNDPGGAARPNGGRLELQENMSLSGNPGDRDAVVIDAADLPPASFVAPPVPLTAAIRLGRGNEFDRMANGPKRRQRQCEYRDRY